MGPERGSGVPEVTQQVLVGGRPPGCYFPVVLGSPSSAPLPAGRRLHQCWLPRPRKTHFFPLSSQRKQKWLSSQRSPCQRVGRFQDASEWTRGPGAVAADWAMRLSIPQAMPPGNVRNLQTLEVRAAGWPQEGKQQGSDVGSIQLSCSVVSDSYPSERGV